MGEILRRAAVGGALLTIGACAGSSSDNPPSADAAVADAAIADARLAPDAGPPADARAPDAGPLDATPRVCGDGLRAPGEVCLAAPMIIDGGGYVFSARLADVDGDGVRDLVWLARDRIVWRLGDGHGNFAAPVSGPATVSDQLAVGDVNLDGTPDLVAAGLDTMAVWIGQGGGAFGAPITMSLDRPASALAVADFDGYPGDEITLATNTSLQTFRVASSTSLVLMTENDYAEVVRLHARDVDGDFRADAIVTYDDGLVVYPGEADGVSGIYSVDRGGPYADATYGDLDGDRLADAIVAQPSPPAIVTHRAADLDNAWPATDVSALGSPQLVDAADLDADGTADVIAGFPAADSIAVLASGPGGALVPAATVALPDRPTELHADGDVNGDGLADLVITLPQQIVVVETSAP